MFQVFSTKFQARHASAPTVRRCGCALEQGKVNLQSHLHRVLNGVIRQYYINRACTNLPLASFALANPRTVLANPPDPCISTARKIRGFAKTKFRFGTSVGANNASERFVQAFEFPNRCFEVLRVPQAAPCAWRQATFPQPSGVVPSAAAVMLGTDRIGRVAQ